MEVEDWRTVARDRASCTERDIRRAELAVEDWRTVARDRASPRGTSGGRSWRSRTGGWWPGIEPHREGHQEGGVGGRRLEDGGPV